MDLTLCVCSRAPPKAVLPPVWKRGAAGRVGNCLGRCLSWCLSFPRQNRDVVSGVTRKRGEGPGTGLVSTAARQLQQPAGCLWSGRDVTSDTRSSSLLDWGSRQRQNGAAAPPSPPPQAFPSHPSHPLWQDGILSVSAQHHLLFPNIPGAPSAHPGRVWSPRDPPLVPGLGQHPTTLHPKGTLLWSF